MSERRHSRRLSTFHEELVVMMTMRSGSVLQALVGVRKDIQSLNNDLKEIWSYSLCQSQLP